MKNYLLILFYLIQHRYTPLHIACDNGHAPVVRLLLKAGAKIEAKDHLGFACFVLNELMTSVKDLFGLYDVAVRHFISQHIVATCPLFAC